MARSAVEIQFEINRCSRELESELEFIRSCEQDDAPYNLSPNRGKVMYLRARIPELNNELASVREKEQRDEHARRDKITEQTRRQDQNRIEEQIRQMQVNQKKIVTTGATAESLTKRGFLFLEECNWKKAFEYFDNALDINPEYAPAYVGLLWVELRINNDSQFASQQKLFTDNLNFKKALRFADPIYRANLNDIAKKVQTRIEALHLEQKCIVEEKQQQYAIHDYEGGKQKGIRALEILMKKLFDRYEE